MLDFAKMSHYKSVEKRAYLGFLAAFDCLLSAKKAPESDDGPGDGPP